MDLLLKRTQAQEAADNALLAEAGVIEAARRAEAAARRAAGEYMCPCSGLNVEAWLQPIYCFSRTCLA